MSIWAFHRALAVFLYSADIPTLFPEHSAAGHLFADDVQAYHFMLVGLSLPNYVLLQKLVAFLMNFTSVRLPASVISNLTFFLELKPTETGFKWLRCLC